MCVCSVLTRGGWGMVTARSMWIMIAGPYRGGASTEEGRAANLAAMNRVAVEVFDKGHIPIIGVNLALPMIEAAGQEQYDRLMMPISLAAASRCDAVLRVGGASAGADEEVESFVRRGLPVFRSINEIPSISRGA